MSKDLSLLNLTNSNFLENYLPILIFFGVATALVAGILFFSYIITPQRPDDNKNSPYECGFNTVSDSRSLFNIRFYLVAILFVVFDVEVVFMYPFALVAKTISISGFWFAIAFIVLFLIAFVYEFKKGVLEWY